MTEVIVKTSSILNWPKQPLGLGDALAGPRCKFWGRFTGKASWGQTSEGRSDRSGEFIYLCTYMYVSVRIYTNIYNNIDMQDCMLPPSLS